jgi:hypothetical protein
MTDQELEELGKKMWKLHRDETDPLLKEIFGLIHKQTVNLRSGDHGPGLRDMMMDTLRGLSRTLAERRH